MVVADAQDKPMDRRRTAKQIEHRREPAEKLFPEIAHRFSRPLWNWMTMPVNPRVVSTPHSTFRLVGCQVGKNNGWPVHTYKQNGKTRAKQLRNQEQAQLYERQIQPSFAFDPLNDSGCVGQVRDPADRWSHRSAAWADAAR